MPPQSLPALPEHLDELPTIDVATFVAQFAQAHGVSAARTTLDDWADAMTRVCGDELQGDETTQLLVTMKRQNYLGARQFSRLVLNHLRERKARRAGASLN